MPRLFALLFLANIALIVIALINCLSADADEVRALPRIAWVFIILLFSPIGPIVYLVAGRPLASGTKSGRWPPGNGFPEAKRPQRPIAPDDDPDFLKGLTKQSQEDSELLRRWEEDLRRREEEIKKREGGEKPES